MMLFAVIYRVCSLLQRFWNRMKILMFGSKGTIFVFHEIDTVNQKNVDSSSFCTIELFKQTIEKYRGELCSLDEFLAHEESNKYVITFDDVPESVYSNAYPLLCKYGIPFVIYLSPKFIGCKGFLSIEQIKEMASNPICTVGAHTMRHTKLRYEKDCFREMQDSKILLESIISRPVVHLAYPFGRADSVSRHVRREVQRAGFISATCTIPTNVPKHFDKWYIPRIAIWEK